MSFGYRMMKVMAVKVTETLETVVTQKAMVTGKMPPPQPPPPNIPILIVVLRPNPVALEFVGGLRTCRAQAALAAHAFPLKVEYHNGLGDVWPRDVGILGLAKRAE